MKIPSTAKRVFKGIIFDVYQWPQIMFDGSISTFEMLKRPNTVEIIATKGNKIFLSKQSQPNKKDFYSLFGGRADDGEEPLETAKRELLEESGMKSSDWTLYKTFTPIHKIDWEIYTFIAKDCEKIESQKLDSGEKIEIVESTFDEFIKIVESGEYWGNELRFEICKLQQNKHDFENFKAKLFGIQPEN